jgi:hypothetical protein
MELNCFITYLFLGFYLRINSIWTTLSALRSLPRVPPVVVRGLKFWAVQNFLPRPAPFRFLPAFCHVYNSTVARLKLDINASLLFYGVWPWSSRKALCDRGFSVRKVLSRNVSKHVSSITVGGHNLVRRANWDPRGQSRHLLSMSNSGGTYIKNLKTTCRVLW